MYTIDVSVFVVDVLEGKGNEIFLMKYLSTQPINVIRFQLSTICGYEYFNLLALGFALERLNVSTLRK